MFRNGRGERFKFDEVVVRIISFINQDTSANYKFWVGTDSQNYDKEKENIISTGIVVYREGKGGIFFVSEETIPKIDSINLKILTETDKSLKMMKQLEETDLILHLNVDNISIHIDASEDGESRVAINECIGYVKGMGYNYEIKPNSFAASCVADRYTLKSHKTNP